MRRGLVLASLVVLACGGVAQGQQSPAPPLLSDLKSTREPGPEEVRAVYPRQAFDVSARVRLTCTLTIQGKLANCRVIDERPRDRGFAAAALALASGFAYKPVPAESEVTIPIWFDPQDAPSAKGAVVTVPDWLRRPDPDLLRTAFPKGAKASKGTARLGCTLTVQGLLRECEVLSETPAGQGFGGAALAIAPQFLFRPATINGRPVENNIAVPVQFSCEGSCGSVVSGPGARKLLNGIAWAEAPSQLEMVSAYPPKAKAAHILGVASIECTMNSEGSLKNCETMSEEPRNQGFGRAAQSLAKYFRRPINVPPEVKLDGVVTRLTFTFGEQMFDGAPYVAKPRFGAAPTYKEMREAYPAAALKEGILTSSATARCKVNVGGELSDCQIVAEQPAGKGIGEAVLALAPKFKLTTWTDDGLPVIGTSVRLPIRFDLREKPDGPAAPSQGQ
jgi:TonB family protein